MGASQISQNGLKRGQINEFIKRYFLNLKKEYSELQLPGIESRVSLKNLMIVGNVFEKITDRQRLTPDEQSRRIEQYRKNFGIKCEKMAIQDIQKKFSRFMVLGEAGTGKSTCLKWLVLWEIKRQTSNKRIPIYVSLKSFSDTSKSLMNFLVEHFQRYNLTDIDILLEKLLEQGKCFILMDDLEAIPGAQKEWAFQEIQHFSEQYARNQFVISCRTAAYDYFFEQFVEIEIDYLSEQQRSKIVRHCFSEDVQIAEAFQEKIRDVREIKKLIELPLTLILACLVFRRNSELPKRSGELYEEALEILLRTQGSADEPEGQDGYKQLPMNQQLVLLSRIAFQSMVKCEWRISHTDLVEDISEMLKEHTGILETQREARCQEVLKALTVHQNVLLKTEENNYVFSRRMFREYFVARYIVDNMDNNSLSALLEVHMLDQQWREVFLLLTEMLSEADKLFLLMKAMIEKGIADKKLVNFFKMTRMIIRKYLLAASEEANPLFVFCILVAFAFTRNLTVELENPLPINSTRRRVRDNLLLLAVEHADDKELEFVQKLACNFVRGHGHLFMDAKEVEWDLDGVLDRALDIALNQDAQQPERFACEVQRVLARDFSRAMDIASMRDHSRSYDRTLDIARGLELTRALGFVRNRDQELADDIGQLIELVRELELSALQALDACLYLVRLLKHCLNTAGNISADLRTHLENDLFIVAE